MINNLSHYGDVLAIPLFALAALYFYNIKHKTLTEYTLLLFSISGLVLDIFFTYLYLKRMNA
jgi:short subunit fatty acids transporter